MAYFNFNYITPAPNDEFVNPVTQLNANIQEVENKTKGFSTKPETVVNPPIGTEGLYPLDPPSDNYRVAVWNGTDWCRSISHNAGWTAWQAVNCRAPVVPRPGYPPAARVNVNLNLVELSGGVLYGASAPAWPTGYTELFTDTDFGAMFIPANGGFSMHQVATGQITTVAGFASAVVWAEGVGGTRCAVKAAYQGDAGGGNFIMLNGVRWWFSGNAF